ncbi:MAG: hypothetical protein ACRDSJ_14855 [Rubrobacteraceae bacterium]
MANLGREAKKVVDKATKGGKGSGTTGSKKGKKSGGSAKGGSSVEKAARKVLKK